ncbi:MAG: NAD(P)-binding protein [Bdellovibrionales bacterium]|nr:NAD(P)-binding protein [Bdellovibrionales bacterium]
MSGPNTSIEPEGEPAPHPRRSFLKSAALWTLGAALPGALTLRYFTNRRPKPVPGRILGASAKTGHLLREGRFPAPSKVETTDTVIIGGGISGLSAGWWLERNHQTSYRILELEEEAGGNSRSGRNQISAYPWGAHYLPIPGPEARYVRTLLEEVGVIRGYSSKGLPVYDEFHLCADPGERLFLQGSWQEGLVPQTGAGSRDREEYREFFSLMDRFRKERGSDGKRHFAIPLELGSADAKYRALDRITMKAFLEERNWHSNYLHWYVNYCCRDDYGATYDRVSAWAGIHYFAARAGIAENAEPQHLLTWPEGNGWLVSQLRKKVEPRIRTRALVHSVRNEGGKVLADHFNPDTGETTRIQAKHAIFAAPRFVANRIVPELASRGTPASVGYSPWMVANVSLSSLPGGRGAPLSWDNVSYSSPALGYVVATHQNLNLHPKKTVITYYHPLSHTDPVSARKEAHQRTHTEWCEMIIADLSKTHSGIAEVIENIDVWVWGHAMAIPEPGFITGSDRKAMAKPVGKIHFAHSDMSGIPIFEEAQYRGVMAAKSVLRELGIAQREDS